MKLFNKKGQAKNSKKRKVMAIGTRKGRVRQNLARSFLS